jgi:integrase/recombinase XerD
MPAKRPSKRLPAQPLTPDDVRGLIRACSRRAPTGIRNAALIATLARSGLRISEALALRPSDVNLKAGTLFVGRGKGDKTRTVPFVADDAVALLGRWLERRTRLGINGRAPVFCTLDGGPMQTSYIRALLPRLGKRAGIEGRRVHAHALRHTLATELAQSGAVPLPEIAAQLGHASVATTNAYLAKIAPAMLVERMRRVKLPSLT